MKISDVKVTLSGDDLLSIFNEFVSVEGLEVKKIWIEDDIKFAGTFKKGFSVDFEGSINVTAVDAGKVSADITSFKVMKIGLFSLVRRMAMKYILKAFEVKGIIIDNGKVLINIKKILEDVKFIDFDVAHLFTSKGSLQAEVTNIDISVKGELIKEKEPEPKTEEEVKEEEAMNIDEKIEDGYSTGRLILADKLPTKAKKYSDYIFVLPDLIALLYRLLKDSRVSVKTKLIISGAVAYIVCPTDIIPDSIPFIGSVDELAVAFFALNTIIEDVPLNVIVENWEGKNDIILVIRNIIEYVTNFTGAKNVDKLYRFVEELVTV
ncbi:MAG: DUF1232 domain-containing protein [Clostridium sp.]